MMRLESIAASNLYELKTMTGFFIRCCKALAQSFDGGNRNFEELREQSWVNWFHRHKQNRFQCAHRFCGNIVFSHEILFVILRNHQFAERLQSLCHRRQSIALQSRQNGPTARA